MRVALEAAEAPGAVVEAPAPPEEPAAEVAPEPISAPESPAENDEPAPEVDEPTLSLLDMDPEELDGPADSPILPNPPTESASEDS